MRCFVCLGIILFFCACSSSEIQRDGGDLTRSEVEFLSEKMVQTIEKEFPLLQHRRVNRYITTLGQAIVSHNSDMPPLPYEFRVLRSNEVFVFSLPNGLTYISLGMLRAVDFEGQLAASIAHELAHQQLGHYLKQWRRKVNANRGQHFLLDFSGDWRETFLGPAGVLRLSAGAEEEADKLSAVILYHASFDPRLYVSYLQLLKKLEQSDREKVAIMMSLHPLIADRLQWAKTGLAQVPPLKDSNVSSQSFQEIKFVLKEAAKQIEKRKVKKDP